MKVLSIIEPFASLIKEGKKRVETRSFKTNYRGYLYIHVSLTKKNIFNSQDLLNLLENTEFKYGYIICKCKLVDCIYMTKEFVSDMMENHYQEYICGEYKEGRYAWILDDIEEVNPIKAKGQLGIWNYYSEEEILSLMDNIEYGYVDNKGNKYTDDYQNFSSLYVLSSPDEVIKSRVGVCFDQVELERYYFKNTCFDVKTYFIVHDVGIKDSHTFLTYTNNGKYYWFEHAFADYRGIHEYNSLKDLLCDVSEKFINDIENPILDKIKIYCYPKPTYHMSVLEFFNYLEKKDLIKIDKL